MSSDQRSPVSLASVDRATITKENAEHSSIIGRGVAAWNEWREKKPDLIPKLIGVSLFNAKLSGVNFRDTLLIQSDIRGADLQGADLGNANADSADFHRASLKGADLSFCSLQGAKFGSVTAQGANFRGADLQSADFNNSMLKDCIFANCKMWEVNLQYAQLQGADVSGADLEAAKLEYANLEAADMRGALLQHCDLHGAMLDRCRINKAIFGFTRIIAVDLCAVLGVNEAIHKFPSSVGTDTLDLTAAGLTHNDDDRLSCVEEFYRQAGVQEHLLGFLRNGKRKPFRSCFISYSHADKAFARVLYRQLQKLGVRCWLDEHSLKPGERILDALDQAIRSQDRVLLCCSRASLDSWWVKDEIRKAQERERREESTVIVPIMLDAYLLDGWDDGLASDLRSRLAVDFIAWEEDGTRFKKGLDHLLGALSIDHDVSK